ncbi:hypothetical protein ACOI92_13945, partial [Corynebacterium striatum]|uniref:hypothetical protein n=1 Tax=Corynebacterium striatum TaxID=43770 RepID=UPI003B5976DA
DVFSLIGPKRYDAPWKDIEAFLDRMSPGGLSSVPQSLRYLIEVSQVLFRLSRWENLEHAKKI